MFSIMLVEDDDKIRTIVADTLRKWQFEVHEVTAYDQVLAEFNRLGPQLVLLDVNLPVLDGYHWCQQIRAASKVPILFLSSRNQNMDMIMAMNMGADDFVQKPFDLGVLVAKVNALLRRNYLYHEESLQLAHRGLTLNVANSTLHYQGTSTELSRNEFIIMQLFMRSIGRIVSREELMQALWREEQFVDDNTLTVNVNRLRRRLAQLGMEDLINTRKGMGYIAE